MKDEMLASLQEQRELDLTPHIHEISKDASTGMRKAGAILRVISKGCDLIADVYDNADSVNVVGACFNKFKDGFIDLQEHLVKEYYEPIMDITNELNDVLNPEEEESSES